MNSPPGDIRRWIWIVKNILNGYSIRPRQQQIYRWSPPGIGCGGKSDLSLLTLTITLKCVKFKTVNLCLHFKPAFYEKNQMDHALNSSSDRSCGGHGNQF